ILPRLYRQAPLNSIWEGSGNVQCLDVLRALAREPETGEALFAEVAAARGAHPALDAAVVLLHSELADDSDPASRARFLVERMALVLQASLLVRASSPVAEAFCRSRLAGEHGLGFGTLRPTADFGAILARALPE
ncbi:MAG: DNA alkylation response protein, partial [Thermomonas sp.]